MENLENMKKQFDSLISEMINKKRVDNSALISVEKYDILIEEVKSAKLLKKSKKEYHLLKR